MEEAHKDKTVITFVAVVLIAIIVVAAVAASPKKQTASASTGASSNSTPGITSSTTFKDGSYTATGSYESPGGNENVTVHVTLSNGVITASSVENGAQDPEASEYQALFISGYKSQVVGKNIAEVHLSRVSGSSLTSQGFNDALSQIENQAKV